MGLRGLGVSYLKALTISDSSALYPGPQVPFSTQLPVGVTALVLPDGIWACLLC